MEFFNNTDNDNLKFKLNSEGININKIEPRLILTTSENVNYFFVGKLKNDICEFDIPELSLYEKNDSGKIKFEIISEDLYFPVWEDEFKVVTKASIKMEEMFVTEHKQTVKPKITTNVIFEKTAPIKKEEPKEIIKEEKHEEKRHEKPKTDRPSSGMKSFTSFSDFKV